MSLISPALAGRFFITVSVSISPIIFIIPVKRFLLCASSDKNPYPFIPPPKCTSIFSHVQLFVTPWTLANQAPLSMGFSRQEYCSGLPFPSLGNVPDSRIKPLSLVSPAMAGQFFTQLSCQGSPTLRGIFKYLQSVSVHFESRPSYKRSRIVVQTLRSSEILNRLSNQQQREYVLVKT